MTVTAAADHPSDTRTVSSWMTLLFATACGLIAANIYYAQPLAGPISAALGLPPAAQGLIVTLTQLGYVAGLLLVVPLGDLVENRRLILILTGLAALALLATALAAHPVPFLAAALAIGVASVAVQVIVPYAASMAPDASRGRLVGNIMSGLMMGIMLARPTASFIAEIASWQAVFLLSAVAMILLAVVLRVALPPRVPVAQMRYDALLRSMARLSVTSVVLRRRAFYQACLFGAFSLFWTTVPLLLASPAFHLSQGGIALFALAGVAGAVASPIAGRMADRGWTRPATGLAMLSVAAALLLTHLGVGGSRWSLGVLVAAAILLDFGATTNLVLGQRAIYALGAEYRSRFNGLYMAMFFTGGAVGSAVGGWAYALDGWVLASWIGLAFPIAALAYFVTERRQDE